MCRFQDQNGADFNCSIERVDLNQGDFKGGDTWYINNSEIDELVEKIKSAGLKLESVCETISAGIKSTADDVFCKPVTDKFVEENNLETEFIHPYLQAKNISKWSISWTGKTEKKDTYIIYPHRDSDGRTVAVGLDEMPNIAFWFEKNKSQLAGRKYVLEAGRNWYEIWVPQKVGYFTAPYKIVTPDFSTHNRYALDTKNYWCGGNAFMIVPKRQEEDYVLFLLGLMNSSILEYFHKKASSTFIYAGRYRYTATAIKRYPIPQAKEVNVEKVASIVKTLMNNPSDDMLFEELDFLVAKLYGISKEELEKVKQELAN